MDILELVPEVSTPTMYNNCVLDNKIINIVLMYKRQKKFKEPYGYQPNNPLTIYYKKYIESTSESKKYPRKKIKKKVK